MRRAYRLDVRHFMAMLEPAAPATIRRRLSALSSLFKHLVRAGKIRDYASSDMPAWLAMSAATIASERRVPGPIAIQVEYPLVARDGGMGVMPWSPLAGDVLTGKYRREGTSGRGRLRYCEDCHVADVVDDPAISSGVRSYALDPERAKALWLRSEEMIHERS